MNQQQISTRRFRVLWYCCQNYSLNCLMRCLWSRRKCQVFRSSQNSCWAKILKFEKYQPCLVRWKYQQQLLLLPKLFWSFNSQRKEMKPIREGTKFSNRKYHTTNVGKWNIWNNFSQRENLLVEYIILFIVLLVVDSLTRVLLKDSLV